MSSSVRCEPSESIRDEIGSCVAEVLGISTDDLVPDVPLTSLGLESFLAVRLRRRLRDRLGLDLPLTAFLGQASLLSLEALADGRPENEESFPLTPVQAAYWVGRDPAFPLGGVGTFYYYEYDRSPGTGYQETDLKRLEEAWN